MEKSITIGTIEIDDFSPFLIIAVNVIPEQPIAQWNMAPAATLDRSVEPAETVEHVEPKPSESNDIGLWIMVAVLSAGAAVSIAVISRKKKK